MWWCRTFAIAAKGSGDDGKRGEGASGGVKPRLLPLRNHDPFDYVINILPAFGPPVHLSGPKQPAFIVTFFSFVQSTITRRLIFSTQVRAVGYCTYEETRIATLKLRLMSSIHIPKFLTLLSPPVDCQLTFDFQSPPSNFCIVW
jgi:hypothetical protein